MATGTTSFSVERIKDVAVLSHITYHNERTDDDKTGSNIDANRIMLNETLYGKEHVDLWKTIAGKIRGQEYEDDEFYNKKGNCRIHKNNIYYEDGRKFNKNGVLAFECKSHYPGELKLAKMVDGHVEYLTEEEIANPPKDSFGWPADMDKYNEWKKITTEFIVERYGEENVEQIVLHLDESTPNIHAVVTPMIKDEHGRTRFRADEILGGPKEMSQLQTDYANRLEHLGFHRGQEYSQEINVGLNRARHLLTKSLEEELPDDKELANEMYQAALTQNNQLELKLMNKTVSATTQSKLRKKVAEQDAKIKELESKIAEQKQTLQFVEFEKQGLRDLRFSDPELYKQYQKSKEIIIDVGMDSFDRINVIDKNDEILNEEKQAFLDIDDHGDAEI